MTDKKISDLVAAAIAADADLIEITQIAGGPTSKKLTLGLLNWAIEKDIACGDELTALTTGVKVTFRWKSKPITQDLKITASLTNAQLSGATLVTIDLKKNGTSVFSTKPTFDNTEKITDTAVAPAVLSATGIAYNDEITCIVDNLQSGSIASGLKIYIEGKP